MIFIKIIFHPLPEDKNINFIICGLENIKMIYYKLPVALAVNLKCIAKSEINLEESEIYI